MIDEDTLGMADCRYMLVVCSAFINCLVFKTDKVEIQL